MPDRAIVRGTVLLICAASTPGDATLVCGWDDGPREPEEQP